VHIRGKPSVNVDFGLLSMLVKQQVYQKFLFPSPVVRVDTKALDDRLRRELKSLLGLPRKYPTVLLHFQLALWPTRFVAGLRAMRFAWRLAHTTWIGEMIRSAWRRGQVKRTRSQDPLFDYGPLKYLGDTLNEYELSWDDILGEQFSPKPKPTSKPKEQQMAWYTECYEKVCVQLARHYLSKRSALPQYLKACLPSSLEETLTVVRSKKVAPFLAESGDLGRAALRLQAPTLAICPSTRHEPMCELCGTEPESPMHLLHRCRALPQTMLRERAELLQQRAMAVHKAAGRHLKDGLATTMADAWSATLQWDGRTAPAVNRLLWLAGCMIDYYSKRVAPVDPASPPDRSVQVLSASRVRPCRLSPVCRGRVTLGHDVPSHAG
jgi:hypothetical protein